LLRRGPCGAGGAARRPTARRGSTGIAEPARVAHAPGEPWSWGAPRELRHARRLGCGPFRGDARAPAPRRAPHRAADLGVPVRGSADRCADGEAAHRGPVAVAASADAGGDGPDTAGARHARPRRGDGRRVVVPARRAPIGVDVGASAHGGWTNERREHPGRRDPRVGLEPSVRPQHRERGGRHPRAERPPAAPAGPQRRGDRAAWRFPGGAGAFLSVLRGLLREGLKWSQEHLASGLAAVLEPERPIDDTLYEELEELLLAADLGATLAADFTNRAREEVMFRSEEHTSELQSPCNLVCRLLLEKKKRPRS